MVPQTGSKPHRDPGTQGRFPDRPLAGPLPYHRRHRRRRCPGFSFYAPFDDSRFGRAPTIWCSWTSYYADVTEDDIVENADWVAGNLLPYGFDYVQLDDGYDRGERGVWHVRRRGGHELAGADPRPSPLLLGRPRARARCASSRSTSGARGPWVSTRTTCPLRWSPTTPRSSSSTRCSADPSSWGRPAKSPAPTPSPHSSGTPRASASSARPAPSPVRPTRSSSTFRTG